MAKKCRFIRLERKQREELNAFIGVLVAKQSLSSLRRVQAVMLSDAGKMPSEIARTLGACEASVYRWLLGYRKFGPAGLAGRVQPGKLTPEQIDKLLGISGRRPVQDGKAGKKPWSFRKISRWAKSNWNVSISAVRLRQIILKRILMDK
ncbi:MAG: helix-turn-helix domain-containing protein [Planctomycetes bacterium]|nr:helix-turn-helix domain-containing protein [Planctomycetota bacterium]